METVTTLYLVRHGETEWNTQHRMQGHRDSPLTPAGIRQAERLGEALQAVRWDMIYTSSSGRAYRTAELVRGSQTADIVACDALKEIHLGDWEGRTQEEIKTAELDRLERYWREPDRFDGGSGESFHDVQQRAVSKLNDILKEQHGKTVLIVTHTVVLKLLMAHFESRPLRNIWNPPFLHPACLCKVEIRNGSSGYCCPWRHKPLSMIGMDASKSKPAPRIQPEAGFTVLIQIKHVHIIAQLFQVIE